MIDLSKVAANLGGESQLNHSVAFRSRKALLLTETELRLIPEPAIMGLSSKQIQTSMHIDDKESNEWGVQCLPISLRPPPS